MHPGRLCWSSAAIKRNPFSEPANTSSCSLRNSCSKGISGPPTRDLAPSLSRRPGACTIREVPWHPGSVIAPQEGQAAPLDTACAPQEARAPSFRAAMSREDGRQFVLGREKPIPGLRDVAQSPDLHTLLVSLAAGRPCAHLQSQSP